MAIVGHLPIAGTSTASSSNGKRQVDLFFSGVATALGAMDMFPMCSIVIPVRPMDPFGGIGRLLQFADCDFRSVEMYADG